MIVLIMFLILFVKSILCCFWVFVVLSILWKVSILLKMDVVFVRVSGVDDSILFCFVVRIWWMLWFNLCVKVIMLCGLLR